MTYTVTVYNSGNSKVITIPAKLSVQQGEQFTLEVYEDGFFLKRQKDSEESKIRQIRAYATHSIVSTFPMSLNHPETLDQFLEKNYE